LWEFSNSEGSLHVLHLKLTCKEAFGNVMVKHFVAESGQSQRFEFLSAYLFSFLLGHIGVLFSTFRHVFECAEVMALMSEMLIEVLFEFTLMFFTLLKKEERSTVPGEATNICELINSSLTFYRVHNY